MGSNERAITGFDDPPPKVTRQIADESAAWVARLHGPGRTRHMELQCLEWQARSAAHRHAFERCTEVWMGVPAAARLAGYVPRQPRARGLVGTEGGARRKALAAAACSVLVAGVVVGTLVVWPERSEYRTAVGEARTVVLSDGTRMFVNTDTRLEVGFRREQRRVRVLSGEVAFDVAKDASRPFVVRVAGSEMRALGTSFAVRLVPAGPGAGRLLSVTRLEGSVLLRPADGADEPSPATSQAIMMRPSDRVQVKEAPAGATVTAQRLDPAQLDQLTAWKRNEVVFDRTTLRDAVAEMNRYSRTPIKLATAAIADRLVSGVCRTGDNRGFARSVTTLHGLTLVERADHLELGPNSWPRKSASS